MSIPVQVTSEELYPYMRAVFADDARPPWEDFSPNLALPEQDAEDFKAVRAAWLAWQARLSAMLLESRIRAAGLD